MSQFNLPWLIGGDFNVILSEREKIDGLPMTLQEIEDFFFCINSCELDILKEAHSHGGIVGEQGMTVFLRGWITYSLMIIFRHELQR